MVHYFCRWSTRKLVLKDQLAHLAAITLGEQAVQEQYKDIVDSYMQRKTDRTEKLLEAMDKVSPGIRCSQLSGTEPHGCLRVMCVAQPTAHSPQPLATL